MNDKINGWNIDGELEYLHILESSRKDYTTSATTMGYIFLKITCYAKLCNKNQRVYRKKILMTYLKKHSNQIKMLA